MGRGWAWGREIQDFKTQDTRGRGSAGEKRLNREVAKVAKGARRRRLVHIRGT
jgi:hypothetical protein